MPAGRKISKHIDEFNKIVLDIANIKVKIKDEDLVLLLLTSLPESYEHFMDTFLYERVALTSEDVMATLNSKEIKERSKAKRVVDHLKRNYLKINCKKSTGYVKKDDQPSSSGSIYDSFKGSVLLGDNRECKIRGISKSGKVKVINGSSVVLSGTRRDNYVYSLDCHAVACELNASIEEKDSLAQTGKTVKKLRTDNSLEFYNRKFEQLCTKSGIARYLTVTGMPQQNGLAERMNRTLTDKVTIDSD
ncbi:retrovirus-related pol polyprotein from transposon TNT 1-94 [Tanacetum coccineum]